MKPFTLSINANTIDIIKMFSENRIDLTLILNHFEKKIPSLVCPLILKALKAVRPET